jgi:hypothetical protein
MGKCLTLNVMCRMRFRKWLIILQLVSLEQRMCCKCFATDDVFFRIEQISHERFAEEFPEQPMRHPGHICLIVHLTCEHCYTVASFPAITWNTEPCMLKLAARRCNEAVEAAALEEAQAKRTAERNLERETV